MKILLLDLMPLIKAFNSLGGRDVEVSDGDAKRVINKPFDIDGQARHAIARMRAAAKVHVQAVNDERDILIEKHGGDAKAIDTDPVKSKEFLKDFNKFLKSEVDFSDHRIPISAIKIQTNQLDPALIEALLPVLDGEV